MFCVTETVAAVLAVYCAGFQVRRAERERKAAEKAAFEAKVEERRNLKKQQNQ